MAKMLTISTKGAAYNNKFLNQQNSLVYVKNSLNLPLKNQTNHKIREENEVFLQFITKGHWK